MSRYRIGRADTNDIVLADATVSREHAELVELGGGRFQIRDLGSTYGVSIWQGEGWQKVAEIELRHDSRLRIGDHKTTVADLLRDMDRTVVRPRASEAPREATAPPAAAAPPLPPEAPAVSAPPAEPPAVPDDDATAPPAARTAPAAPKPAPAPPRRAPPRPAAPRPAAAPFQFLRDLPPEKRILVWLGLGFAGFLLIALITLVLALAL